MAERHPKFSQHLFRDALLSTGGFLLLSMAVHFVLMSERIRQNQEFRATITEKVAFLRTALEAELNANVFLAHGLAAPVIAVPEMQDQTITTALRTVYRLGNHIRNVKAGRDRWARYGPDQDGPAQRTPEAAATVA